MVKAGIASGFRFLWRDSGIEVPFNLTGYRPSDTILALLWTGIVNTLLVSAVSIAVATVIGFTVGLLRLSRNWLLSTLAAAYVEFVRNIPLLFFVLFWYFGVLAALPTPRESLSVLDVAFLNRRGLSIPTPNEVTGFRLALLATCAADRRTMGPRALGAGAPGADRPRLPDLAGGLRDCGALPVLAFVAGGRRHAVGRAGLARLQLSRRLRAGAGVRGTVCRPLDLHRGLHRRGGAGRHPVGAAGPDRCRPRARPHPRPHRAAGRDPAGHAGDHPADHQPVPQPDQEFLVRRRDRLSRDRRGVHGLGPGLDRPVDRDHRHYLGDLPDPQPRGVGLHELVQRPPSAGPQR